MKVTAPLGLAVHVVLGLVVSGASAVEAPTPSSGEVLFVGVAATFSQVGFNVVNTIDNAPGTAWGVDGRDVDARDHESALFETSTGAGHAGGTTFTFFLDFHTFGQHGVNAFTLHATTDPRPLSIEDSSWTALRPFFAISLAGADLVIDTDDTGISITVAGRNPELDRYMVRTETSMTGITGFRLDVHEDSLGRVGRSANGNFALSRFWILDDRSPRVLLRNATATHSQSNIDLAVYNVLVGARRSVSGGGWGLFGDGGAVASTAVLETVENVGLEAGSRLTFTLDFGSFSLHSFGRYRLAVTNARREDFADGLPSGGDTGDAGVVEWVTLSPTGVESTGGSVLVVEDDSSIVAGGLTPEFDVHVVTATTPLAGITGIRIDVLEDQRLPMNGPGRASNGNGVLGELRLELLPVPVKGIGPLLRGDSNADGRHNISDPVNTLNFLFIDADSEILCLAAADANGDGRDLNISDAIYSLGNLFLGGPRPPKPFPECDVTTEPAQMELGCEDASACEHWPG